MSLLPYASLTHRRKKFRVTGDVVLLSSQTATSDSAISFTSGITSTYGEYIFRFYNMNPETDGADFSFQVNATDDAGGDYDVSLITSSFFRAYHTEADAISLAYVASRDLAQSADFQQISQDSSNGADASLAGEMHLFNPSSTTYVKHFYVHTQFMQDSPASFGNFVGGYINDTTAIDDIQFKFSSGDFDGTIKLWGVK